MTNTFEFVIGLVNVFLLYFVLKAFVIDPLKKVAKEREEQAQRRMDDAESVLAEARTHLDRYQGLMGGLEAEKKKIEESGRSDAEKLKTRMASEAEAEAGHMVNRARQEARMERDAAVAELRDKVAEETVQRARKLLQGGLDDSGRKDILENFLAKVGGADA